MKIIEYILLGLGIVITIGWCLQVRQKAKNEQKREKALELQGFLMSISIASTLLFSLSPFHLLWMLPVSFILGLLSIGTPLKILWIFSSIYFLFWYVGISNIGRKFYVTGEYEKAIAEYLKEIKKKPTAEGYFNLALAYGKLAEHENEIWSYNESLKISSTQPETYYNLGKAYSDAGEKMKAIQSFKKAASHRSNYLKAHIGLSETYAEIGDIDNALKELNIVNTLDKDAGDRLVQILKEKGTS